MENELIPNFRHDLELNLIEDSGQKYVFMYDRFGYSENQIAVTLEFYQFLASLNGDTKYSDLPEILGTDDILLIENIISNIKNLDELFLLESPAFNQKRDELEKEYLDLDDRPYICAGNSYPEDPAKLEIFLDELFAQADKEKYVSDAAGIIVPHIDLKLRDESHEVYAAGYHSVAETDFDVLVILGTAHYVNTDLMMLTNKNYSTPLGIAETDKDLLELWQKESGNTLHFDEFAHKPEHSLEYHILLSQHYFKDRKFTVLPILSGSFYDFIENKTLPETSARFNQLLSSLKSAIEKSGKKALYIASVDFSHIGRKFHDDYDAAPVLPQIKIEDRKLIDSICKIEKDEFMKKIIDDCDKYKICGTAPIYTMLGLADFKKGDFLKYNQWNETETRSAVSFASIALY